MKPEEIDHHESDLYLKVNGKSQKLIASYKYKMNVVTFLDQITKTLWYDVAFAYTPWWEEKCGRNRKCVL